MLGDIQGIAQLDQENKALPDDFGRAFLNERQKLENAI
jgi:hypothetical protein